jgi:hypothetical protein
MSSKKLSSISLRQSLKTISSPKLFKWVIIFVVTILANLSETLTSRRIAAHILGNLSTVIEDKLLYKQKAL